MWGRGHSMRISSFAHVFFFRFDRTNFKRNHTLQMVMLRNYSFCGTEELDLSERGATLALINDFNLAQQHLFFSRSME